MSNEFSEYIPKPLDTSRIKLSDEVNALSELFAENSHDVWARERMMMDWTYGKSYSEPEKKHPLLKPFSQLPEVERKFNRQNALETIRTLISLGYRRAPNVSQAMLLDQGERDERAKQVLNQIKNPLLKMADLRSLWEERIPLIWSQDIQIYRRGVDAALKHGEGFLAFDIADEGLAKFKDDLRLVQLQALALARTGATRRANAILDKLRMEGHQDEETLGILARTHKDFWQFATDAKEKKEHLRLSYELYSDAYERNGGYYSGINAATTALLFGEKDKARSLAKEVAEICDSTLEFISPDSGERYWLEATLAEASLILGDFDRSQEYYSKGSADTGVNSVVLSRTRSQARLLLEYLGEDAHRLDHCFSLPNIAVFSGHMFDAPGRERPRFPFTLESTIREQLEKRLTELKAAVGYSSLACGADLIFNEILLERGGEVNIVLPYAVREFKLASVDIFPGENWGTRFDAILKQASTVTILSELGDPDDGAVYDYCNQAISGMVLLKSQFLGMDVRPLVVWDKKEGDGIGGTASVVHYWRDVQGMEVGIIETEKDFSKVEIPDPTEAKKILATRILPNLSIIKKNPQELRAMLFADIVGFTKLSEVQIPPFVEHFLGQVAEMMDELEVKPVHQNTWGDAVMCVFESVAAAGIFALKLRDLVRGADWGKWGLPELSIRIALHCGPVFPCYDPVLKKFTYNGAHVNKTARIEPVAEEGQIYASEAFAAIATADGVQEFNCDYVGTKQLAKKYGAIAVFLVRETGLV
ncbi:TRAFs-binding domain-containing protein [Verrucomicrobia bacterium]|nr:TRAFs-binding domain-containing protein [Verrucomicrobiota bacterium]